jgi:hypothetical protein
MKAVPSYRGDETREHDKVQLRLSHSLRARQVRSNKFADQVFDFASDKSLIITGKFIGETVSQA